MMRLTLGLTWTIVLASPLLAGDTTLRLAAPPSPDLDAGDARRLLRITQQPNHNPRIIVTQPLRANPQDKPTLVSPKTSSSTLRILTRPDTTRVAQPVITSYGSTTGVQTIRVPARSPHIENVGLPAPAPGRSPHFISVGLPENATHPRPEKTIQHTPPASPISHRDSTPSINWTAVRKQNAYESQQRFPRIPVHRQGDWVYYADRYGNPSIPVRTAEVVTIGNSNGYFRQVRYSTYLQPYAYLVPPGWSPMNPCFQPRWNYRNAPAFRPHDQGASLFLRVNF